MSTSQVVLLVVIVLLVLVVAAALAARARSRRRTEQLRGTFGPEYDRTVEGTGSRTAAERELAERKSRYDQLQLRPLSPASRERYQGTWTGVQARFVDAPEAALGEADRLVTQLMTERGFPADSLRTQEEVLSVEHGHVLEAFRAGHAVEEQSARGEAGTEQVRQAMLHFRTVFEELLDDDRGGVGTFGAAPEGSARREDVDDRDDRGPDDRRG